MRQGVGMERIVFRALAGLVPCDNPHWQELFYRWFLSMVAHWRGMDRQHGNSTSPLLVGSQGFRKSTYCRILLPPELRFGYADSLDFSSKQEAERALGRFFLINLDEFDQITVNQQGFLKHLLQNRQPICASLTEPACANYAAMPHSSAPAIRRICSPTPREAVALFVSK